MKHRLEKDYKLTIYKSYRDCNFQYCLRDLDVGKQIHPR